MLSMEEQKVLVEEILGSPLPQLDEIYMQGAKLYDTTAPNRFITPYPPHRCSISGSSA